MIIDGSIGCIATSGADSQCSDAVFIYIGKCCQIINNSADIFCSDIWIFQLPGFARALSLIRSIGNNSDKSLFCHFFSIKTCCLFFNSTARMCDNDSRILMSFIKIIRKINDGCNRNILAIPVFKIYFLL